MRPFFVLLIWLVAAVPGMAQRGLRAGILVSSNASTLRGAEATYGTEYRPGAGFGGGLTVRYAVASRLDLRLDARWERLAPRVWGMTRDLFNVPMGETYIRQRYDGLSLPLTAQFHLGRRAYVLVGPLAHVLLQQVQVSDGNIWTWDGAEIKVFKKGDAITGASVEYPGRLRRLSPGVVAGAGLTLNPSSRAQVFVELTSSLIRTQALRDGFALYNNDPRLPSNRNGWRYGAPQPRSATLRTVTVTTGLTLGRRAD